MITEPIKWGKERQARDTGIEQAANQDSQSWQIVALQAIYDYALKKRRFLIEDVRVFAAKRGIEAPPDNRAWGAVTQMASRLRWIERTGYAPARSSHYSPKPIWTSNIHTKHGIYSGHHSFKSYLTELG